MGRRGALRFSCQMSGGCCVSFYFEERRGQSLTLSTTTLLDAGFTFLSAFLGGMVEGDACGISCNGEVQSPL